MGMSPEDCGWGFSGGGMEKRGRQQTKGGGKPCCEQQTKMMRISSSPVWWCLYVCGYYMVVDMEVQRKCGIPEPWDPRIQSLGGGYKNKQSKRAAEGVIEVGVSKQ